MDVHSPNDVEASITKGASSTDDLLSSPHSVIFKASSPDLNHSVEVLCSSTDHVSIESMDKTNSDLEEPNEKHHATPIIDDSDAPAPIADEQPSAQIVDVGAADSLVDQNTKSGDSRVDDADIPTIEVEMKESIVEDNCVLHDDNGESNSAHEVDDAVTAALYTDGKGEITADDVDPFEDTVKPVETRSPRKIAISPIEWDRISEESEKEELRFDATGDEFYREEELHKKDVPDEPSPEKETPKHSDAISKLEKYLKDARYFMIKSNNFENVEIAKERDVWATTKANENRLNKAFFDSSNVLLIFSVRESGKFQGVARIMASSDPRIKVSWVLPPRMNSNLLSSPFRIEWLTKRELSFSRVSHLNNPWNENKPVKIGRDGQEIEGDCGESLCRVFFEDLDHNRSLLRDDSLSRRRVTERLGRPYRDARTAGQGLLGDAMIRHQVTDKRSLLNLAGMPSLLGTHGTRLAVGAPPPLMQVNVAAMAAAAAMAAMKTSSASGRSSSTVTMNTSAQLNRLANQTGLSSLFPPASGALGRMLPTGPTASVPGLLPLLTGSQVAGTALPHLLHPNMTSHALSGTGSALPTGGNHSLRERDRNKRDSRSPSSGESYDSYSRERGSRRRNREDGPRSRDRSRHRGRRSRSSSYPIDRNVLMNWDYDDYVQQVSRGLRHPMHPGLVGPTLADANAHLAANHDRDQRYEERVDAFLRGIDSRREDQRSYSRSHSRSYSPSPNTYDRREEWHAREAYSRSRSPSVRHSRGRDHRREENEHEDDRYYRRSPARYQSPPRRRAPSPVPRSPPYVAEQDDPYWRRGSRSIYADSEGHRRYPEQRFPRRHEPSPRYAADGRDRSVYGNGRRYR